MDHDEWKNMDDVDYRCRQCGLVSSWLGWLRSKLLVDV